MLQTLVALSGTLEEPNVWPSQLALAAFIAGPLISALVWVVKRSELRWERQVASEQKLREEQVSKAEARADRYEARMIDLQERVTDLLKVSAETNKEVIVELRALNRGSGQLGHR